MDEALQGHGDVLSFWLDECGPAEWYAGGDPLDAAIRERFGASWQEARAGGLRAWCGTARGALAFVILTDQFPRNMFRGDARAFATDAAARRAATSAIARGFDRETPEPERQFFYLPLEHSESLTDQQRAVRLIASRMQAPDTLLHARAHREVIRSFGRFPYRNDALGRASSPREIAYLEAGGYGSTLRSLQDA